LVSLVSPLTSPAAADTVPDCPSFQTWDSEQGACVPLVDVTTEEETPDYTIDPRDETVETPTIEVPIDDDTDVMPTPTPSLDPDVIDTIPIESGSVTINKHRCPSGYDASGASFYDLAAACTESPNGILFGVSDGAAEFATGTTGSAFAGGFQIDGLPLAGTAIYEKNVPAGGTSVIFCDGYTADEGGPSNWENFETVENQIFYDFNEAPLLYCDWFNLVPSTGTVSIIITKHVCPELYDASAEDYYDLALNCPDTLDGIEFGVSDGASQIAAGTTGSSAPGQVQLDGLPAGATAIYEKNVPDGMHSVVFCAGMLPDDPGPIDFAKMTQSEANQIFDVLQENETLYCSWYNVYDMPDDGGYGAVTIYKWLCPEGFNPQGAGADPASACTEAMDGVTFTMDRPGKDALVSNTGDSIPGAVQFGGQEAGDYVITETLPQGIASAFVWECTGGGTGWVHSAPLSIGASLELTIAAGDAIICQWFNVPETDPELGHLTVIKYVCSGPTYVSDVDCEIHENGVTFDLLTWNGSGWNLADTRTTNGSGTINWNNLAAGSYVLDEYGSEPCHATSTFQDGSDHILVTPGEETVVKVYNCTDPGETPVTGKPSVKYPNTGMAPTSMTPAYRSYPTP
jgi:hypothetical protein